MKNTVEYVYENDLGRMKCITIDTEPVGCEYFYTLCDLATGELDMGYATKERIIFLLNRHGVKADW